MTGDGIVALARKWIGTPYVHQASCVGVGCDCLGLLRGVWREAFGAEPEAIPPYTADWSEASGDEALWRAAKRCLIEKPLNATSPGDVLLFRMSENSVAKHLGIAAHMAGGATFIHAYSRHGVVESALGLPWARRVVARFQFPGLQVNS